MRKIRDIIANKSGNIKKTSRLQSLINEIGKSFGVANTSSWERQLKSMPLDLIYRFYRETIDYRPRSKVRFFFWKVKEWKKTTKKQ